MSRKTRRGVKLAVVFLVTLTSFTIAISSLLFVSKLNLQSSKPFAIISEGASEQVAFGGSFSPSYGIKRSVFLQAKDKQGWSTVARSTLDQSGKFNFSIDTTEGITSYRATVGKTPFRQSSPELNIATCNAPGSTRTSTSSTIVVLEVTGDLIWKQTINY